MGVAGNMGRVLQVGGSDRSRAAERQPYVRGYDPGEATVDEVRAYVADHPRQLQSILDAEREGKNRVTLVEALVAHGGK